MLLSLTPASSKSADYGSIMTLCAHNNKYKALRILLDTPTQRSQEIFLAWFGTLHKVSH